MTVSCPCCLRCEERSPATAAMGAQGTTVVRAGARRPADPAREAWSVVARSLTGTLGPIVGVCPTCGQPLVGEVGMPAAPYRIALGDGELTIEADRTLRGPAGLLTLAEAEALVAAGAPRPARAPLLGLFQATLLSIMIVPFLVWALAIVVVVAFLSRADTAF